MIGTDSVRASGGQAGTAPCVAAPSAVAQDAVAAARHDIARPTARNPVLAAAHRTAGAAGTTSPAGTGMAPAGRGALALPHTASRAVEPAKRPAAGRMVEPTQRPAAGSSAEPGPRRAAASTVEWKLRRGPRHDIARPATCQTQWATANHTARAVPRGTLWRDSDMSRAAGHGIVRARTGGASWLGGGGCTGHACTGGGPMTRIDDRATGALAFFVAPMAALSATSNGDASWTRPEITRPGNNTMPAAAHYFPAAAPGETSPAADDTMRRAARHHVGSARLGAASAARGSPAAAVRTGAASATRDRPAATARAASATRGSAASATRGSPAAGAPGSAASTTRGGPAAAARAGAGPSPARAATGRRVTGRAGNR